MLKIMMLTLRIKLRIKYTRALLLQFSDGKIVIALNDTCELFFADLLVDFFMTIA